MIPRYPLVRLDMICQVFVFSVPVISSKTKYLVSIGSSILSFQDFNEMTGMPNRLLVIELIHKRLDCSSFSNLRGERLILLIKVAPPCHSLARKNLTRFLIGDL